MSALRALFRIILKQQSGFFALCLAVALAGSAPFPHGTAATLGSVPNICPAANTQL